MSPPRPITLLQLSDLQFGRHHRFEGEASLGGLLDRVVQDLDKLRDAEDLRPDLVLLTGDLSEWGMDGELDQARRFAEGLRDRLGLATRRVVLLPGNHDINRKLCEGYFASCEGRGKKPVLPYFPKYAPFAEMFERFYTGEPGIGFTEKEPWSLFEYPDLRVVVAALDSTIADSHRAEDHFGFVGESQIRWFIEKLRPYRERGWLRIAAVHHDILAPEAEAAKADRSDLGEMLAPWINLVLHGHTHVEQLQWLDGKTPVPVLGIGSAGVKVAERPAEVPNQYQIVKVFADHLEYGRRAYLPDKKRFGGCLRSDPGGNAWKLERQVAFDSVAATFETGVTPRPAPGADQAALIEKYRAAWARLEAREGLFDIAPRGEDEGIERGLDLLGIFVPPKARRDASAGDALGPTGGEEELPSRLRKRSRRPRPGETGGMQARRSVGPPQPVQRLVTSADAPWITLLGAPGAGKTALTRWLGLKTCVPGETPGEALRDLVPVRIELRRFGEEYRLAKEAGGSHDFFDHVDAVHRERSIDLRGEPLRKLAEAGRILWLFDGLDEVPDAHRRKDIAKMIGGVRLRYGGRGVVTSRIAGVSPALAALEHAGLQTHTLMDFQEEEIEAFIERWHTHALPGAPDVARKRKERLRRTLRESPPVRELVKSPLLLTLVALLNRGAELPRRRHLIYEEVVHLMVERWEANKHGSNSHGRLDAGQKKKLLRQVAWRMMTELPDGAGNVIEEGELSAIVTEFCERELGEGSERAQSTTQGIIDELRERNGVLVLLGGRLFGFLHRTLLEYLAASEAVARFRSHLWEMQAIKDLFRGHWHEEEWQEVLWLICGMLQEERPAHVVDLVQTVIDKVGPFDDDDHQGHAVAFAIRCLGEVRDMQQEPVRSLAMALTEAMLEAGPLSLDTIIPLGDCHYVMNLAWTDALRFCGQDWPGAVLFAHDVESAGIFSGGGYLTSLFCLMAVTPTAGRVDLLREVLSRKGLHPIIEEITDALNDLGAWTSVESDRIKMLLHGLPKDLAERTLSSIAHSKVEDASLLMDVMKSLELDGLEVGCAVAAALARSLRHRSAALQAWQRLASRHGLEAVLLTAGRPFIEAVTEEASFRSRIGRVVVSEAFSDAPMGEHGRRGQVHARSLAMHAAITWRDVELLNRLVDHMLSSPRANGAEILVSRLEKEAHLWRAAHEALETVTENQEKLSAAGRWAVARALFNAGDARAIPMLVEVAARGSDRHRVRAARLLAELPATRPQAIRLLADLREGRHRSSQPTAVLAGVELADLLADLGDDAAASTAFRIARDDGASSEERLDAIRKLANRRDPEALRIVEQLAATAEPSAVRLHAARLLQQSGAPPTTWRPVLEHLSRSASTGAQRLEAARALRDEKRIEQLSRRAKKERVRKAAARSLEQMRRHQAILAVGKKRRARVSANGVLTGHLEETDTGTRFSYISEYISRPDALPLSPTLPLRKEPYDSPGIHPFFENLLPEGWLLDVTCRKLGMDRTDAFGLLLATCSDCAGSVEIAPDQPGRTDTTSSARSRRAA